MNWPKAGAGAAGRQFGGDRSTEAVGMAVSAVKRDLRAARAYLA